MGLQATFGGLIASGQRWSIGLHFALVGTPATPTATQMSAWANQLFDDFASSAWDATATGTVNLRSIAGAAATFDSVRTYWRPSEAGPATVIGASTRTPFVGSGSPNLPPQCAIVATLLTEFAGKSYKGRIYLPNRTEIVDASGNFAATRAKLMATTVANFISLARTRSVGSQLAIPAVLGQYGANQITAVAVDTVVDTQRRRRDKVVAIGRPVTNVIVG